MKKKLIEIARSVEAINKASAQEEIRVICYPPAPLDTEDLGRIWEFAFKYNAYEKLGSFQAVCKLAHEREKVFMDTGKWVGTVDELRACLFFEQRRWRHMGEVPGRITSQSNPALIGQSATSGAKSNPRLLFPTIL